MKPSADKLIRCRFCGFTVMKFHRLSGGKVVSGWPRLFAHVEDQHPDEAETISDTLDTTYLGEANS